ncbi:hypothetical protein MNBD_GAMMA03-1554, partial [hydrothermal vent metagenome]
MSILKKHKYILWLALVSFVATTLVSPDAMAGHGLGWANDMQKVGDGINVASAPKDTELKQNPNSNSISCADPVYLHSGEFYYECVDLVIPGRGMDVQIKHHYRSGKNYNKMFGYGWTLNYHQRLLTLANGNVVIVGETGRSDEYEYDSAIDSYTPPPGFFEELVQNGDGSWTLTKAKGNKVHFNVDGTLAALEDRNGNMISFAYDPAGLLPFYGKSSFGLDPDQSLVLGYDYRLTRITDTVGREIDLNYNANGQLENIIDYAGRMLEFAYDPDTNDLLTIKKPTSAQYPGGLSKTFTYEEHNLTSITDAKGQTFVTNVYNTNGEVFNQILGGGNFYFNYSGITTVTDRKGFITRYSFNEQGNPLTKATQTKATWPNTPIIYLTSYTYNTDMLKTSVTNPKGNGVVYVYDESNANARARGNLLEIRRKSDMSQADDDTQDLVTRIIYESAYNLPIEIEDAKGNVYSNIYDAKGNVIEIKQPMVDGQVPTTYLSYNPYGQVTQVTDPNGNITTYDYFPSTGYVKTITQDPAGINAAREFTWDEFGYLDTVKDANGDVNDYDFNEYQWLIQETNPL